MVCEKITGKPMPVALRHSSPCQARRIHRCYAGFRRLPCARSKQKGASRWILFHVWGIFAANIDFLGTEYYKIIIEDAKIL